MVDVAGEEAVLTPEVVEAAGDKVVMKLNILDHMQILNSLMVVAVVEVDQLPVETEAPHDDRLMNRCIKGDQ